jgi:hypothetical protein
LLCRFAPAESSERTIGESPINGQNLASNVGGGVAGKKDRSTDHFLAFGDSIHRRPVIDPSAFVGSLGVRIGVLWRNNETGRDRVDPNFGREFLRSGASERLDAALRAE